MPKQKTDDLVALIRSLTRAEKRHFRLFVKRNQSSEDILFLQLFDFLEKRGEYEEDVILKKIPDVKKSQLSNLKAHLYKQLLTSLRLLSTKNANDIQIREMVDYARVLYNKGLYRQSLDMLEKAKSRAKAGNYHALALEILEFEKHIEGQYITRSIEGRADSLAAETLDLTRIIEQTHAFSNLALQLYGLYLKVGYVRNEKDAQEVKQFFYAKLPKADYKSLDFMGKVYYNQAHMWYYHMNQEFTSCYRYAQRWVDLYKEEPEMLELHTPLYLKGLHNLLSTLYNMLHYNRYAEVFEDLINFPKRFDMADDNNIEGLYFLFKYIHAIQKHFIEGTFSEGIALIPELMEIIESDRYNWDHHRILVFYYRIACLYFGSGDNDNAITYLNLIINQKNPDYRADIQVFARILNLIAHFEMGNAQLVEYQVKSVYRFLSKMEDIGAVHREVFRFLRRIPRMREQELRNEFISLRDKLIKLENDPFERRPFMYLDIISWLESKIEDKEVQDVIREKFVGRRLR
ncbi:hypothetical protein [Haliscomenobacter sp.]|uniref:hypothetical protein n=1 Tax=Haliscomenobacter sp. TaxID=2717303 RepID=UPI003BAB8EF1